MQHRRGRPHRLPEPVHDADAQSGPAHALGPRGRPRRQPRQHARDPELHVDTVAPDTTINTGPNAPTNNTAPQFTFSANEPDATFQCRLDTPSGPGTYQSCTSPRTLSTTAQGTYTLLVRATDLASNTDQTPASRSFTVDTTAPNTTIDTGPSNSVSSTTATFTFGSTETGSSFQCSLDGAAFGACLASYTGLSQGSHTFQVRATDPAGNTDGTPATRTWTVDTQAPAAPAITAPANNAVLGTQTFTLSGTAEANSTVEILEGTTSRGTTTTNAGGTWSRQLTSVPEGSHSYTATARDAAGNVSGPSQARTVIVDTGEPDAAGHHRGAERAGQDHLVEFRFTGESGATFECALDTRRLRAVHVAEVLLRPRRGQPHVRRAPDRRGRQRQ